MSSSPTKSTSTKSTSTSKTTSTSTSSSSSRPPSPLKSSRNTQHQQHSHQLPSPPLSATGAIFKRDKENNSNNNIPKSSTSSRPPSPIKSNNHHHHHHHDSRARTKTLESQQPTVSQLLSQSTTTQSTPPQSTTPRSSRPSSPTKLNQSHDDVHMITAGRGGIGGGQGAGIGGGDVGVGGGRMANSEGVVSWRKGQGFSPKEKLILNKQQVRRKADLAQLYFYDHYFDLLTYLYNRKKRTELFKSDVVDRELSPSEITTEWISYTGRERALLRKRRTKLKLDMFHVVCQVGQGGYGEIFLAKQKDSGEIVALKRMRKKTLAKMDEIRHVLTERDILASTDSPWLVRLLYAFQDPTYIYLAMDFVAGGDFRTLLNNSGVLKEEHAKFYMAEMFLSVDTLHRLGYIHRDLKPENFLIDRQGHIKLTDFGLASGALNPGRLERLKHKLEEVKDQDFVLRSTVEMKSIYKSMRMEEPRFADSVVGSPDYMAIDTLRGQSYDHSVDYWSLGAILFEFLAGYPPFSGATPEETWANLKNWQKVLRRPHYDRPEDRIFNLSDEGWGGIVAFIAPRETRVSDIDKVKQLPFFRGVPWDHLRDTNAPFVPQLDSEIDAGYFDDFSNEADLAKYAEVKAKQRKVDGIPEDEKAFNRGVWVGFTFKAKKGESGSANEFGLVPPKAEEGREFREDELEMMF